MIKHISPLMLAMWLRCQEQFRRRYIEGEKIPPGITALRGKGVHKAADINYTQKIKTEKDLPLSDLQDAARDEFIHAAQEGVFIPNKDDKKKLLNKGLQQAIDATEVYKTDIAPNNQPKLIEQRLTADIGVGLPLLGILDLVTEDKKIKDLKIMKKKNQRWADNEIQPTIYSILAKKNDIHFDEFEYEFIIPNKTMVPDRITTQRDHRDYARLVQYINSFLSSLETGMFAPCEPSHWL